MNTVLGRYWGSAALAADDETGAAETVEQGASDGAPANPTESAADSGAAEGAAAAPESSQETPKASPPQWFTKRINQMTAQRAQIERENAALRERLGQMEQQMRRGEAPTDSSGQMVPMAEVQKLAQQLAEQEAQRRAVEMLPQLSAEQEFARRCNDVVEKGKGKYGQDFMVGVQNLQLAASNGTGRLSQEFLEAVLETDDPVEVVRALSSDLDRAVEIAAMSPTRLAAAMIKLGMEVSGAKAPPPTPKRTNAPPPVPTSVGSGNTPASRSIYDDNLSMADFVRLREEQLAKRRAR